MDAEAVRTAFRSFVGEPRYRRFVRAVNTIDRRLGRMRYWQEADWSRFARRHPGCAMPFEAILEAFRVCEVHGGELVEGPTPVWYGLSFRDEFLKERLTSFPWAMILGDRDNDWFRRGDPVFFCRECRESAKPWYRMRAVVMPSGFKQE
jgi:hypothetical protein